MKDKLRRLTKSPTCQGGLHHMRISRTQIVPESGHQPTREPGGEACLRNGGAGGKAYRRLKMRLFTVAEVAAP